MFGIEQFQKLFGNRISFGVQQRCNGNIKLKGFENSLDIGIFRLKEFHCRQAAQQFRIVLQHIHESPDLPVVTVQHIPLVLF